MTSLRDLFGAATAEVRYRLAPSAETGQSSLWPWPVATGLVAIAAAAVLIRAPDLEGRWATLAWPGDRESAATMLQVVAASVITATTLAFSLVVVALQLASQQFSPRLLRRFTRDRPTKAVLSVLVGTFAFAVTVLRSLEGDGGPPSSAMAVVYGLSLVSLGALVGFIAYVARALRVDTMMVSVHEEAAAGIEEFHPPAGGAGDDPPPAPPGAEVLRSSASGFVQVVDSDNLVEELAPHDLVVRMLVRPGDHLVTGAPVALAWSWREGRAGPADPAGTRTAGAAVANNVEVGYERTLAQDPSFGFRLLADIAVKALSPSVNDPVTAAHSVGHMADLLVRLCGRDLGPRAHRDDAGVVRLVTVDRDFRYHLDLACGQVRRYGRHEPAVLAALLQLLRDVACHATTDEHRTEVARQVALIVDSARDSALEADLELVRDLVARVELALAGRLVEAYADRSGETRST